MRLFFVLLFVTVIVAACGCNNQREPRNIGTESSKPRRSDLNTSAPVVHTTNSNFSRIITIRLKPATDLFEGLNEAVKQQNIKNAVILSGIGSLTSYRVHVVNNTDFPPQEVFPEAAAPQDLLNVNGYVIAGRVHAHICFSDEDKALGGHLEPGTKVFTFAIVTLGILEEGASLMRFDDWRW